MNTAQFSPFGWNIHVDSKWNSSDVDSLRSEVTDSEISCQSCSSEAKLSGTQREFSQIWHRCPFKLEDKLIRSFFWHHFAQIVPTVQIFSAAGCNVKNPLVEFKASLLQHPHLKSLICVVYWASGDCCCTKWPNSFWWCTEAKNGDSKWSWSRDSECSFTYNVIYIITESYASDSWAFAVLVHK